MIKCAHGVFKRELGPTIKKLDDDGLFMKNRVVSPSKRTGPKGRFNTGSTCKVALRPTGNGTKCPPGHYVRPNTKGQACCYKIPKISKGTTKTMTAAYTKWGYTVPASVKELFGIKNGVAPATPNASTAPRIERMVASMRQRNGTTKPFETIRIAGRQCERYSLKELRDMIVESKIVMDASKLKKDAICAKRQRRYLGNAAYVPRVKGAEIHPGRIGKRLMQSFPKQYLVNVAKAMNNSCLLYTSDAADE